jgi:ABC-2 type transport system ATP-binding protein
MVAELRGVTKRYGSVTALDDVTLELEAGQVMALLGPNGAGKTTAVKLLLGLTPPTRGTVTLFGSDPRSLDARRRTGVMLQISKVPEALKVREHVHLFCSYYPSSMPVDGALAAAGLSSLGDRKYGELSGGERQRVQFALAICGNPDLLFLDEPTVGLDVESRRAFWQHVRRLSASGRAIVLTTHYLEEADALADRIVMVNRGRIVADGPPHMVKSLTAARRIRCVSRIGIERVRALSGVRSVRQDGASLEILTSDADDLARRLFSIDPSLSGLEITGAGLEEAFLTLTSRPEPTTDTSACGPHEESGVPNAAAALGCESGVPNAASALGCESEVFRAPQRERVGVGPHAQ